MINYKLEQHKRVNTIGKSKYRLAALIFRKSIRKRIPCKYLKTTSKERAESFNLKEYRDYRNWEKHYRAYNRKPVKVMYDLAVKNTYWGKIRYERANLFCKKGVI